jgi:hypothetical protein
LHLILHPVALATHRPHADVFGVAAAAARQVDGRADTINGCLRSCFTERDR